MRGFNTIRSFAAAFLVAVAIPLFASAHAFLDHAEPKVGSEQSASPTIVKVWMSEEVEPKFCSLRVFNSDGAEVDQKDCHVDDSDHKLLSVSVPKLGAGQYKVAWSVVAADTHRTHGEFKFTVKP